MQSLIYLFVIAVGAGLAAAGYFALNLTIIEALLTGLAIIAICLFFVERNIRRRAHERLERSVQDLSRLLSTDAQAGQALSKRINTLESVEAAQRLDVIEADVSVLGTVLRQLAETVSDLEDTQGHIGGKNPVAAVEAPSEEEVEEKDELEPVIPIELLRQAIDEGRLLYYVQPIVTLPGRRVHGYDIIPHLLMEDGEVAGPEDFMPRNGHGDVVRMIESRAMIQAVAFARRTKTQGAPVVVYVPMTEATLGNAAARQQLLAQFDANQAIARELCIKVSEADWKHLSALEDKGLEALMEKGARYSIGKLKSLRLTFSELMQAGVRSVRVDAKRIVDDPESYTDFHTSDIAPYLQRYEMDLIVTGVSTEQQVLTLIDDGMNLAQGQHIAKPGPIRDDLAHNQTSAPRRAASLN
ncbi:MAG: EAL domain-containing protein [Hyphomicrobiaceae bacterium]|nr:EAL domain-containing protein [Hyphomicrobiaceae bacterium]MCC0022995.1 EAL domain-containing protein [Hyphomicrobiaceae bacterium]